MNANDNRPQYLTPEQLAARWLNRITPRTLANWRCLGLGPRFRKIGGRILYPIAEVEDWEATRTAESTSGYKTA